MKKHLLFLCLWPIFCNIANAASSVNFGEKTSDEASSAKVENSTPSNNTTLNQYGMVNLPSGMLQSTGKINQYTVTGKDGKVYKGTDYRFSSAKIKSIRDEAVNARKLFSEFKNRYVDTVFARYPEFATSSSVDPLLLAAFSAVESNMCKWKLSSYCPSASGTGAVGLMQITGVAAKDVATRLKPSISSLYEVSGGYKPNRYYSTTAVGMASTILHYTGRDLTRLTSSRNGKKPAYNYKDRLGLPMDNPVYVLRSYNTGIGDQLNILTKSNAKYKNNTYYAIQYPYRIAMIYHFIGGNKPYFSALLNGYDPYLEALGQSGGTGNFDPSSLDGTVPETYSRPEASCSTDTASPLDTPKLLVSEVYGDTYDYKNGENRKNIYTSVSTESGKEIKSMTKGTVLTVENNENIGTVVKIQNENGSVWAYGSTKDVRVSAGQTIEKGDVIALTSSNNAANEPRLVLAYFKDAKQNLALSEDNANLDDPLGYYCGDVDIPSELTSAPITLSEMTTDIKTEQANSLMGALEQLVNNRTNPQWLSDISVMPKARLYAEMAYMNAIDMQINLITSRLVEKTTALDSVRLSLQREKMAKDKADDAKSALFSTPKLRAN